MQVKYMVDGVKLKDYLLTELVSSTYRDLIEDEYFRAKTGINKLGTLTYHTKKLGITMDSIYNYGLENLLIPAEMSMNDWYESTRGRKYSKKGKKLTEKDIYIQIGSYIGLDMGNNFKKEVIKSTIEDFLDKNEFNELYKKAKKELGK